MLNYSLYSKLGNDKTCVKRPFSKRLKIGFQDQLSLNAGQKYCRMLQGEHSAILSIFIKLPFVIKIFVLSIFEWPFYTDFTVSYNQINLTYSDETNGLARSQLELMSHGGTAKDQHQAPIKVLLRRSFSLRPDPWSCN